MAGIGASQMFSFSKKRVSDRSGPISPEQVAHYYRRGVQEVSPLPGSTDKYLTHEETPTPDFEWDRLTGGDYDRLEGKLTESSLRRLREDRDLQEKRFSAEMRKRGIADDPAYFQLRGETIDTPYARAEADVLSDAASTRYGLQGKELEGLNQARMQQGWLQYQSPRDYWLEKMNTYYGGMADQRRMKDRSFSFTKSDSAYASGGGGG